MECPQDDKVNIFFKCTLESDKINAKFLKNKCVNGAKVLSLVSKNIEKSFDQGFESQAE